MLLVNWSHIDKKTNKFTNKFLRRYLWEKLYAASELASI